MSQYKLVYYSGMNMNLVQGASEIVEADSFNDALSLKCSWPVFEARDHLSAAAQNPGTCVYYTEMWEAVLMDPETGLHQPRLLRRLFRDAVLGSRPLQTAPHP